MWFERIVWFPVLVSFVVALGVSGKHLTSPPSEPATAQAILSFAGVIAGFTITYSPLGSDFTTYYSPDASRLVLTPLAILRYLTLVLQLENFPLLDSRIFVLNCQFPSGFRSYSLCSQD